MIEVETWIDLYQNSFRAVKQAPHPPPPTCAEHRRGWAKPLGSGKSRYSGIGSVGGVVAVQAARGWNLARLGAMDFLLDPVNRFVMELWLIC
jgi:hypothetical protein